MKYIRVDDLLVQQYFEFIKPDVENNIDKLVKDALQNDFLKKELEEIITSKPDVLRGKVSNLISFDIHITKNYKSYVLRKIRKENEISLDSIEERLKGVLENSNSQKITKIIKQVFTNENKKTIEHNKLIQEVGKEVKKQKLDLANIDIKIAGKNAWNEIFDYESLQEKISPWLGTNLSIKVCPYCNNQYVQTLVESPTDTITQFQLDHFYPKSKYPYFALSFHNLIPSCANCNHKKGSIDTMNVDNILIHPYEESFHQVIKFKTTDESDASIIREIVKKGSFKPNNIKVELVLKDNFKGNKDCNDKLNRHKKIFHLESIYAQHSDIVSEIYAKSIYYNDSRKIELENFFKEKSINLHKEEINRFILGNYVDEEDFNKRPHSKLTSDIAEELKLDVFLPKTNIVVQATNTSIPIPPKQGVFKRIYRWLSKMFKLLSEYFEKLAK